MSDSSADHPADPSEGFSSRSDTAFVAPVDAEGVTAWALRLYGDALRATGVVQVVAVYAQQSAEVERPRATRRSADLRVLAIGDEAPESVVDGFALRLARARADAIVTTGAVLRAEPQLRHGLDGPGAEALWDWRRRVAGKERPPHTLVLSSGRDLDLGHPVFEGPGRAIVFTGSEGAWELESRALDRGIEVVASPEPSARAAIAFLRRAFGAATISIEAGPHTARDLYDEPVALDEVMLSVFDGEPAAAARGPALVDQDTLERTLPLSSTPWSITEPSGRWVFSRRRRV